MAIQQRDAALRDATWLWNCSFVNKRMFLLWILGQFVEKCGRNMVIILEAVFRLRCCSKPLMIDNKDKIVHLSFINESCSLRFSCPQWVWNMKLLKTEIKNLPLPWLLCCFLWDCISVLVQTSSLSEMPFEPFWQTFFNNNSNKNTPTNYIHQHKGQGILVIRRQTCHFYHLDRKLPWLGS